MSLLKKLFSSNRGKQEKQVDISNQRLHQVNKPRQSASRNKARTYKGTSFAQPGEISELFGYANFKIV